MMLRVTNSLQVREGGKVFLDRQQILQQFLTINIKPRMASIAIADPQEIKEAKTVLPQTLDVSITQEHSNRVPTKSRDLPLMIKRANKVEKYICELAEKTFQRNKQKREKYQGTMTTLKPEEPLKIPNKYAKSIFVSELQSISPSLPDTSSLDSFKLNKSDAVRKYETLTQIEEDYVDFKQRLKTNPIVLPRINRVKTQPNDYRNDQVEDRVKKSRVTEEGRDYYGDLYLLTKGRDKIFSSLGRIGEYQLGSSSLSIYSQILNEVNNHNMTVEQTKQMAKNEILMERRKKKLRMLENKALNGNVYYYMHSLSKRQMGNLKKACRFAKNYGIS